MRNFITTLSVSILALCSCFGIWAQSTAPSDTTVAMVDKDDDRYRIGFQDVLEVRVFKHSELSQRVSVSPNGTISLFRLDRPVVAVCKSETELAREIAAAYKAKFIRDPEVTVNVADQRSQSIGVMGAVGKPEYFFVKRRFHLLEMLALAGGPNKESGTRVIVSRTGSTSKCKQADDPDQEVNVYSFKLRDIQEGKKTFWMQPGDLVSVLEADIIYIYGNVQQQGAIKIRESITLTQALATAEGLKPAAKKDKIRVLRQKGDKGEREELVFDMNLIDKGKISDPILQPNDIVAVSEDKAKAILLSFASAIKNTVPNAALRFP